jgi:hypothetical protein
MRIESLYSKNVMATEFSQGLDNTNVPSYFINYTIDILSNDVGFIQTSEVSLLPTNDSNQRILNINCFGQILNLTNNFFVIQFDFSNIQIFQTFSLEQALEGTFSIHDLNIEYNAGNLLYYVFDDFTRKLDIFVNLKKLRLKLSEFYFSLNVYIQDDIDTSSYFFRRLFKSYDFPYNYELPDGTIVSPKGDHQSVALIIPWTSGWYIEDIMKTLGENGITKTSDELFLNIHYVNATYNIPPGFSYNGRIGLQLPLSDGIYSQIPINELPDSGKLALCLQTILSAAPNAEIYIFYFGSLVTNCDEEDEDATFEETRAILQTLTARLTSNINQYDVICNPNNIEVVFSDQGNLEVDMQDFIDDVVVQRKKTMFNMSGNNSKNLETIPQINPGTINCGGTQRLFNGLQQAAFISSGGYYLGTPVDYPGSHIPYHQLGIVTSVIPWDPDLNESYIGVPDIGAFATNMSIYFNKSNIPVSFSNGTELSAASMTGLICLINDLTDYREWDYLHIFYWEHEYLFNYVSEGTNDEYNANAFRTWNPICGLGYINGTRLANLLSTGFVLSDTPIQISNSNMQKQMSYLNFYPLSPMDDPIYLLPTNDFEYSQPVFGPTSIWSQLTFYVVDRSRSRPITPFGGIPIHNNDWIMITMLTTGQTPWFLRFYRNHVRLVLLPDFEDILINPQRQIDPSFFWNVQFENNSTPLRPYDDFQLSPVSEPSLFLTSQFDAIPSILPSSPSITNVSSPLCFFKMSAHPYHLVSPNDEYWKINFSSYYINIANQRFFMTSGVGFNSYIHVRSLVSNLTQPLLPVQYGDFDGFPQWLFIPQPSYHNEVDVSLKFGKYVIYNNRLQAYMFVLHENLILLNANSESMGINHSSYEYCLYSVIGSDPNLTDSSPLFTPSFVPSSGGKSITPYLSNVSISNDTPYFTQPYQYYTRVAFSSENLPGDQNIVHISPIASRGIAPNLYLFWVNTDMMFKSLEQISFQPAFNNNEFLRTNISYSLNNSILFMKNLDSTDPFQKWNITRSNTSTGTYIQTSNFHPEFVILNNFLSTYVFGTIVDNYFMSYANGGPWKPFRSDNEHVDCLWQMIPNYLNIVTSQLQNSIAYTNNYLYKNTLYLVQCPQGVLSCILRGTHTPGLIMPTVNNEDTTIYGSLLYIYAFPN